MTQNQIRFQEHKETQRHNLATEQLGTDQLAETKRYNTLFTGEQRRHNEATEAAQREANVINQQHLERADAENKRHNLNTESISRANVSLGYAQLGETSRHNVATEGESQRHNVQQEQIASRQAGASEMNAEANRNKVGVLSEKNDIDRFSAENRASYNNAMVKQGAAKTVLSVYDTVWDNNSNVVQIGSSFIGNLGNLAKGVLK